MTIIKLNVDVIPKSIRKAAAAAVATNMYIHTYKRGTEYSILRQTEKF